MSLWAAVDFQHNPALANSTPATALTYLVQTLRDPASKETVPIQSFIGSKSTSDDLINLYFASVGTTDAKVPPFAIRNLFPVLSFLYVPCKEEIISSIRRRGLYAPFPCQTSFSLLPGKDTDLREFRERWPGENLPMHPYWVGITMVFWRDFLDLYNLTDAALARRAINDGVISKLVTTSLWTDKSALPADYFEDTYAILLGLRKILKKPEDHALFDLELRRGMLKAYDRAQSRPEAWESWVRLYITLSPTPLFSCGNDGCTKSNQPPLKCSACRFECYCSKACQTEHWKAHKPICKQLKAKQKTEGR
ncbi:hypothetical protein DL93DRAFT_2088607, partial [Clavulina sp. PMI_390]